MKKIKGMMNFDELVTRTLNMCKSMLLETETETRKERNLSEMGTVFSNIRD